MDYQICLENNCHYIRFKPYFGTVAGREAQKLGETALRLGHFKVPGFRFTENGYLEQQTYAERVKDPAFIYSEVERAQKAVSTIMAELLRWQDIAEVVKESKKPQKEG
jgi:hypothetical protein